MRDVTKLGIREEFSYDQSMAVQDLVLSVCTWKVKESTLPWLRLESLS